MDYFTAIVLGLVQGLTEFLPVSSSAHVSIVGQLMGQEDPGAAFTAITQLGTEAAVVIYFWRDITTIIRKWCLSLAGKVAADDPDVRMGWLVIIGTIPIGLLGVLFQDQIETTLRSLWITATMLLVFAFVIMAAERVGTQRRELTDLTWRHGIGYGLFQALALIPGVSRSGGTIAGGLFMGYTRKAAARYSFLLAVPAVIASGGLQVVKIAGGEGTGETGWGPIIIATVIAFAVGYAVIAWFMKFIETHTFTPFMIYRILLALGLFALLGTGTISA
ncbi:undecaprenyl-diphosphate phosphatase [Janibacter hoylei]|uniref:undecaprenyl-diphosphate phosphatase n=1 Tax=Janibacter hoylei TaxID=364298 RepID=UPI0021A3F061|nr:undecaprenyl-diphosphate phosphatase [Janibacter hoylei]MCT1618128.1 undecaprenyl-diphosphate phosphatase [Janibacter hoylei]MCT2292251.1 undecaprenyl-diphosphate phosphatase [Janibacter hoylei]